MDAFLSETVPRHAGVRIEEPDLHSSSSVKAKAPILLASSCRKGLPVHMCGDPQYPALSQDSKRRPPEILEITSSPRCQNVQDMRRGREGGREGRQRKMGIRFWPAIHPSNHPSIHRSFLRLLLRRQYNGLRDCHCLPQRPSLFPLGSFLLHGSCVLLKFPHFSFLFRKRLCSRAYLL